MTARPINLRHPALANIMKGRCTSLHRPLKEGRNRHALAVLEQGDLLWIREPFHMKAKFNHLSPSAADRLGARPFFPGWRIGADDRDELGKQWPARTLPRCFHRHHLRIAAIAQARLKDITNAEIRAEGFADRKAYAAAWNANASTWGGLTYAANPTVLRIAFTYCPDPVPAELLAA